MDISLTRRQKRFIDATATEVLYGGAAGGGKSYGQCIDAFLFAIQHNGSKQLILRKTFAELEISIIRTMLSVYPTDICRYNASSHTFRFTNGSIIDCGYIGTDNDVTRYQSAEYDVIRFDELTHFSEYQYTYMLSRVRGANNFPKQVKSSTNPGSIGHQWVKARFVDCLVPDVEKKIDSTTRVFIPAKVTDNRFLMDSDPTYLDRLQALPESERKALLDGCWDLYDGQYFPEFDRRIHVIDPIPIPKEWRRYRAFDYGLDRFACLWIAIDSARNIYVYREVCESNLLISEAGRKAIDMTDEGEEIYCTYAPPDMWSRTQESGKSKADLFYQAGLKLTQSSNNREAGWLAIKELLKVNAEGQARLHIFSNCTELIKCIPALLIDKKRPTDCATEPHEYTHAPDALRYFAVAWSRPNELPDTTPKREWTQDMWQDYYSASAEEREYIIRKYGKPI